jgi:hypothetical protein
MALFTETIDDAIVVSSVTEIAFGDGAETSFEAVLSDELSVADRAGLDFEVSLSDALDVEDDLDASSLRGVEFADTVSVTDAIAREATYVRTRSDALAVADGILKASSFERQLSDAISVTDLIVGAPTITFLIDEVRALSPTRVRIDFAAPAQINEALTRPTSYVFDNVSAGSFDVVPLSVRLPAGQPSPIYVEIETTEHTDGGTYEVALTSVIRGAAGEFGGGAPVEYDGLGIAPTLRVVIAISPTEVEVHFSEEISNEPDANESRNYTWDGGLSTISVRSVVGSVVTLQTTLQAPGQLYNLHVKAQLTTPLVVSDEVEVEDDVLAEYITFNVIISDDLEVTDQTLLPGHQIFVVVGQYFAPTNETGIQSSPDSGVTWAPEIVPDGFQLYRVAYGLGVNVATSGSGVLVSDGNGTWTSISFGGPDALGVCFSPDLSLFVVGSHNGFFVSSDGYNWTFTTADNSPFSFYYFSVVWSPGLGLFVAGGNDGTLTQTSPDGINWTRHANVFNGIWWQMTWCSGAGLFVATGDGGAPEKLQTSPDGINWTVQSPDLGFTGGWFGCASSSSRMVIAGYNGAAEVQTSDDGITWTHRTLDNGYTGVPYSMTYRADLGLFVFVGDGAEIQTSPDAITWTHRTPGGGVTDAVFRGAG